jgi:hypothetical protein
VARTSLGGRLDGLAIAAAAAADDDAGVADNCRCEAVVAAGGGGGSQVRVDPADGDGHINIAAVSIAEQMW